MTPSGEFLPGMKGLIPRVLDHMYFLMDQSEKAVRYLPLGICVTAVELNWLQRVDAIVLVCTQ
jgi:hypothetical protein